MNNLERCLGWPRPKPVFPIVKGALLGALLGIGATTLTGPGFAQADQDSSALQAAREVTPPTYAGPTTPVTPPKNIKIGVITCLSTIHGCVTPADGIRHAAAKLGWSVTVYDGGGTPSKENAAILDALSSGANVIATIAVDPQLVQLALARRRRPRFRSSPARTASTRPNPVQLKSEAGLGYAYDVAPDYVALGKKIADWIIADSGGKAKLAVYSDKEYPSVIALQNGFLEEMKTCAQCYISPIQYFSRHRSPRYWDRRPWAISDRILRSTTSSPPSTLRHLFK